MYMRRAIRLQQKKKQKVKYKVGQTVRVQYKKEKMGSRSYNEQAGSQRYIITRIDTKSRRHPLYFLSDERGRELTGGGFLQSQLVPIALGDTYGGRPIKKYTRGGKKYARVRWKGYNSTNIDAFDEIKNSPTLIYVFH